MVNLIIRSLVTLLPDWAWTTWRSVIGIRLPGMMRTTGSAAWPTRALTRRPSLANATAATRSLWKLPSVVHHQN